MMLLVKCPKCLHDQKYAPNGNIKSKRCVYCGKTFKVHADLSKSRIVKSI